MESTPDTRYDFDGSHAAPMLLSGDGADPLLVARQEELAEKFERLAHEELDDLVGIATAQFVADSIRRRMSQREGQNSHSYISRRHKLFPNLLLPGYSPVAVWEASKAAKLGTSTPLQSHLAIRAQAMSTGEISNLTTIGAARLHLRQPMREGIEELAGHSIDFGRGSLYRMAFLGTDTHIGTKERPRVLRVGYKSRYGVVDDEAELKGRTTAIIDVRDHRQYDPDLIRYFQELHEAGHPLVETPEFTDIVYSLVDETIEPQKVLAENETTYEVNRKEIERASNRQQRITARRRFFADRRRTSKNTYPAGDYRRYPVGDPRRRALEEYSDD
jgi:hypothetical protein